MLSQLALVTGLPSSNNNGHPFANGSTELNGQGLVASPSPCNLSFGSMWPRSGRGCKVSPHRGIKSLSEIPTAVFSSDNGRAKWLGGLHGLLINYLYRSTLNQSPPFPMSSKLCSTKHNSADPRCKGKIDKRGETHPICQNISNGIRPRLRDCFTPGRYCGEDANFQYLAHRHQGSLQEQ